MRRLPPLRRRRRESLAGFVIDGSVGASSAVRGLPSTRRSELAAARTRFGRGGRRGGRRAALSRLANGARHTAAQPLVGRYAHRWITAFPRFAAVAPRRRALPSQEFVVCYCRATPVVAQRSVVFFRLLPSITAALCARAFVNRREINDFFARVIPSFSFFFFCLLFAPIAGESPWQ